MIGTIYSEELGLSEDRNEAAMSVEDAFRTKLEAALFEIKRVIVGQEDLLERVFVALLTGGHLLIEGVPGRRPGGGGAALGRREHLGRDGAL